MPLFPVPTYTAWQLACIAAVRPFDGSTPANDADTIEIVDELRLRGVAQADVDQMILLAGDVGAYILPMVCMDVDDLEWGINAQASNGVITGDEQRRRLAFVSTRLDFSREQRAGVLSGRKVGWVSELAAASIAIGFGLVCIAKSGLAFCLWLAWLAIVVWLQHVAPVWHQRLRFWYDRGRHSGTG